jgi:hypothetical protein
MKLWALLLASFLFCLPLAAQDSDEPSRGPDGGTHYFVDGISVRPLPGKPFSGRSTTEWTRTLEDGSVVTTHLFAMVARDSQGRIYREGHKFVPANSNEQSKLYRFMILDPITHTRTTCYVATHRCEVTGYHAATSFVPRPPRPFDEGKRVLARESLGNDVIDGINVVGSRETITINAGVVGNSQPLVNTREFWYSSDLQVNLSITRKDPREGTQVIRVGELSRSDPDPGLFQVPANFVVRDNRASAKTEN